VGFIVLQPKQLGRFKVFGGSLDRITMLSRNLKISENSKNISNMDDIVLEGITMQTVVLRYEPKIDQR
jgi:hypothetical protein